MDGQGRNQLSQPHNYLNRELSELAYQYRVLHEATFTRLKVPQNLALLLLLPGTEGKPVYVSAADLIRSNLDRILPGMEILQVSTFRLTRSGDILVRVPYHSFALTTLSFFEEAARDPAVLAVKLVIYRTADDSKVLNALIEAAERNKQVAAIIELKARFEERQNVEWVRRLEHRGIHVGYGTLGLKIHAKIDLIVRDICRLRPGVAGLSENVRVHSLVGHFLEHDRIFYFENDGRPQWFLGSADWMTRNLDRRIEAVAPVDDPELRGDHEETIRSLIERLGQRMLV